YALYRGDLAHPIWFYLFYAVVGIGTLAKGPLGVLLTALVAGSLALFERRWDMIRKFVFHPGVALMLGLAAGWYAIAVARGGEGFFDRQILQENLSRFVGGSGHSHPVYYYLPYLFSQSIPWSLFLPFLLWEIFRRGRRMDTGRRFLTLWFLAMFAFFSISSGKRPVYLLPIYPALALLLAAWFHDAGDAGSGRRWFYRIVAGFAAVTGALLLAITVGAFWNHEFGWFFGPIERLLRAKDRANVVAVRTQLDSFGWSVTWVSLLVGALWLWLGQSLWRARLHAAARLLAAVSILHGFIGWSAVMPVIARDKSYRSFMDEVNRRVGPEQRIFLYGAFNSDPVVFYRGAVIPKLDRPPQIVAADSGAGNGWLIMPERQWKQMQKIAADLPAPMVRSEGKGPEGDAPLVLVRVDLS